MEGLTKYLAEAIGGLFMLLWVAVTSNFGRRISRVEKAVGDNQNDIRHVDGELKRHVDEKFAALDKKLEARRLETKADVRDLHQKIDAGHGEILREIRSRHD